MSVMQWVCVLGAVACSREAGTTSDSLPKPAQVAPVQLQKTPAGASAVKPPPLSTHAATPLNTPDAAVAALPSPDRVYPVQLFERYSERFASGERGVFEGTSFHVGIAADQTKVEISSCDALLALPITGDAQIWLEPEFDSERHFFWSTAVECLALRLMRDARPAQRSRMGQLLLSKDPSRLLPPQLGMVDFDDSGKAVQAAAIQCESWKSHDRRIRLTKKAPGLFAIRAADWTGELEILARGDIDGDGDEDLLVRRDGYVDGGTYAGTALFVLSQTERDPCIRVVRQLGTS